MDNQPQTQTRLTDDRYGTIKRPYLQKYTKDRIRALFLDNIQKIITREQILEVARDPKTRKEPENWHQRLSELRTDEGYTILSKRDNNDLLVGEYVMPTHERRENASRRIKIDPNTWKIVLLLANNRCQWQEDGAVCGLSEGDIDPIGGGRVKLTPDHKKPHAFDPNSDPTNPDDWQALCGRHQVMKKNYWDDTTGWLNVCAIVQSASRADKKKVYDLLKDYFGE